MEKPNKKRLNVAGLYEVGESASTAPLRLLVGQFGSGFQVQVGLNLGRPLGSACSLSRGAAAVDGLNLRRSGFPLAVLQRRLLAT